MTAIHLQHLLSISALDRDTINILLESANQYAEHLQNKTTPRSLEGQVITNLFFEPSTRTRNSFEIAAQRLGAMVLNPNMRALSTIKGESLLDTIHTFEAMGSQALIIRHSDNNTAQFIASELLQPLAVINAGDGSNEHPTQALLDLLTIQQHTADFENLSVAIVGDIEHSRVARSLIQGLKIMGTQDIRLIAPASFLPSDATDLHLTITEKLADGLRDADVVVALRIQKERMHEAAIPDPKKYFSDFGLTPESMSYAKPTAIVMHPGPINRGIEIDSAVADGAQSVILQQVSNGVAVRMAVLNALLA